MVILLAELGHSQTVPSTMPTYWKAALPNGEKTIIPDTGAFGSVTGADLARELAIEAKEHAAKVTTEKLDKQFVIRGVGNGTQSCHFRLNIDLSVPKQMDPLQHSRGNLPLPKEPGQDYPDSTG